AGAADPGAGEVKADLGEQVAVAAEGVGIGAVADVEVGAVVAAVGADPAGEGARQEAGVGQAAVVQLAAEGSEAAAVFDADVDHAAGGEQFLEAMEEEQLDGFGIALQVHQRDPFEHAVGDDGIELARREGSAVEVAADDLEVGEAVLGLAQGDEAGAGLDAFESGDAVLGGKGSGDAAPAGADVEDGGTGGQRQDVLEGGAEGAGDVVAEVVANDLLERVAPADALGAGEDLVHGGLGDFAPVGHGRAGEGEAAIAGAEGEPAGAMEGGGGGGDGAAAAAEQMGGGGAVGRGQRGRGGGRGGRRGEEVEGDEGAGGVPAAAARAGSRAAAAGEVEGAAVEAEGIEHGADFVAEAAMGQLGAEVVEVVLAGELKDGLALLLMAEVEIQMRHGAEDVGFGVEVVEPSDGGGDLPGAAERGGQDGRTAAQPEESDEAAIEEGAEAAVLELEAMAIGLARGGAEAVKSGGIGEVEVADREAAGQARGHAQTPGRNGDDLMDAEIEPGCKAGAIEGAAEQAIAAAGGAA